MKELEMYYSYLEIQERSDITIKNYKINLKKWFDFQKIKRFDDIIKVSFYDIEKYDLFLKNKGLSVNTRFTYTMPISGFYNYLCDRKMISENPYKLNYRRKNKNESEVFSLEDVKKFLYFCKKDRDKAMFSLMFETGMRYCEISNIKLNDICYDDDSYWIDVVGKGNKIRSLGFSKETYDLIQRYIMFTRPNNVSSNILFITKYGMPILNNSLNYTFKKICEKANIKLNKKHIHMTRHTFCTMHIENGDNLKEVQTMMGHNSPDTTLKYYTHINNKKMINKMSNSSLIY